MALRLPKILLPLNLQTIENDGFMGAGGIAAGGEPAAGAGYHPLCELKYTTGEKEGSLLEVS